MATPDEIKQAKLELAKRRLDRRIAQRNNVDVTELISEADATGPIEALQPLFNFMKGRFTGFVDDLTPDIMTENKRQQVQQNPSELADINPYESVGGRFVAGAADLPIGVTQLAANISGVGDERINNAVLAREQRIREGRGDRDGIDFARLAGNVATGIATAPLTPAMQATTLPGRIAAGSATGAMQATAMPVTTQAGVDDFAAEKARQASFGAAAGGILPAVGGAIRGGRNAATGAVNRIVRDSVDDAPRAVQALRAAPTVEQGIGQTDEAMLAGLVRAVSNRSAGTAAATTKATKAMNLSRIRELFRIGGAQGDETLAQTVARTTRERAGQTNALREAAKRSTTPVDARRTINIVNGYIREENSSSGLRRVMEDLRGDLLVDRGGFTTPQTSALKLINLSKDIGAKINQYTPNGTSPNENAVRALSGLKRILDREIGRSVDDYGQYLAKFRELSIPVNKAKIARQLEETLRPITETADDDTATALTQRASSFQRELRNDRNLIKKATGFKRGSLERIYSQEELTKLDTMADAFMNEANFKSIATTGGRSAGLATSGTEMAMPQGPKILERGMVILNNALSRLSGKARGEALDELDRLRLDKNALADLIEKLDDREHTMLKRVLAQLPLERASRTAPGVLAGGSVGRND